MALYLTLRYIAGLRALKLYELLKKSIALYYTILFILLLHRTKPFMLQYTTNCETTDNINYV
jgi:hypothetical protein